MNLHLNLVAHYEGKSKEDVLLSSDGYLNLVDVYIEKQMMKDEENSVYSFIIGKESKIGSKEKS